tara:strand:+ start:3148 stop:3570 length:423 start_codon:yes stop_codon:yes gene_type:complete
MTVMDIGNSIVATSTISARNQAAGTTVNGTGVDCHGASYALCVVNCGDLLLGASLALTLQESPDNVTFTTAKKLGTTDNAVFASIASSNRTAIARINVNNVERYLRVRGVVSVAGSAKYSVTIITVPDATGAATDPEFSV